MVFDFATVYSLSGGGNREQAKIHKVKEKDTWCKVIHRTSRFPECCQRVCFPGYNTVRLLHGWCHVKLLLSRHTLCVHHTTMDQFTVSFYLKPHETVAVSAHTLCTPWTSLQCHFIGSHMKLLLSWHTLCVHHTTMDQFTVSLYLKPHETAAVSAHIVCIPYNHAPVYSVNLFEAT